MRSGRLTGIVLSLALGAILAVPLGAQAATATIGDPPRDVAASGPDLTSVQVTWDGTALVLAMTFAAPSLGSVDVLVSETVSLRDDQRCAANAAVSLRIKVTGDTARLTAADLGEPLVAPAVRSGSTVTFSFTAPELSELLTEDDPFACLSGSAGADSFFGAFDGKVLQITPEAALDALKRVLSVRFGRRFDDARRPWLMCPRQQILAETREFFASAACRFEFRAGSRFHGGDVDLMLASGVLEPRRMSSNAYTKQVHDCGLSATKEGLAQRLRLTGRTLRASRSLGRRCAWLAGRTGPAGDLHDAVVRAYPRSLSHHRVVSMHGTGTAGFEELYRYDCRVGKRGTRYTFACGNKLGDRFVYGFDVIQKPKPKPPPPPPPSGGGGGCDPNYAGACLDPNASDYDCAGGSGNGPSYVQGPVTVIGDDHYGLDSDGDGVACES